jgi:hypothetical protein
MRSMLSFLTHIPLEVFLIAAGTVLILLVFFTAARSFSMRHRRLNREDFVLSSQRTYFQDEKRRVH